MSRRGCLPRLLVAALAFLVVALAIVWIAGPTLAGRAAEQRVRAELADRDLPVRVEGIDVGRGSTNVQRVCIDALPPANGTLACLEGIEVFVDVVAAVRGDVEVERITVASAFVDGRSERGTLDQLRASVEALAERARGRRVREGSGDDRPDRPRRARRRLPDVEVERIDLRLAGQGLPLDGAIIESARIAADDAARSATFALVPRALDLSVVGATTLPERWMVELHQPRVGAPRASIGFETPVGIEPLGEGGPVVGLTGVTAAMPATARLTGLRVDLPGREAPLLETEFVEVELRELTTSLEDLYVARLELARPRAVIPMTSSGALDLDAIRPARSAPDAAASDEGSGAAEGSGPPAAAPADAAPPDALWAERRWWEKLPQTIEVTEGDLTLDIENIGRIGLRGASVEYAIRAINTQLDVDLDATLVANDEPIGAVDLAGAWDWAHRNLELDATLSDIDLGTLSAYARPWLAWQDVRGSMTLATRFRQRTDRTIPDFSGTLSVDDLAIQLWRGPEDARRGVFAEPVRFAPIRYTWQARQDRDDEERRLIWQQGDLQIGDVQLAFTPTLYRLELHRRRVVQGIDIAWSIPRQPVQPLFEAIPATLLGETAGARMTGEFGWDFGFPIRWVEDEDGERRFDLDEPFVDDMDDRDVRLVSLPDAVDIRRLSGPFEFVFRGPDDSIQRELRVPPPLEPDANADDLDEPENLRDWVRLEDIAYPLIAAQLYREDGRFFTNSGINWYQVRLVLEEAARTGWPDRGASTIPMQLVKNVFLTHERTVERKLQELFLTYWMTRLVPKDRVLEVYLNVIEWGPDVNGILEASEYYFDKLPSELNLPESVWLSAITPAPRRRAPQREMGTPPDWQMRWVHDLMRGMHDRGWITDVELEKGLSTPIAFADGSRRSPATTPRTVTAPDRMQPAWLDADQPATPESDGPTTDLTLGAAPSADDTAPDAATRPDPAARTRALIDSQRPLRPGPAAPPSP